MTIEIALSNFYDAVGNRPELIGLKNDELNTLSNWLWGQFAMAYAEGYKQGHAKAREETI